MDTELTFGILTVSDRCFRGETQDESGPFLQELIEKSGKFENPVFVTKCVPDEKVEIEGTLREWADVRKLDVIFTTGGTGFAPRDVTPEATRNIIDKEAPAIPAAILYKSLAKTEMAMLSRAVCGVRKRSLIVNFPGSKKAVGECLGFIMDCLPHAVALLRDNITAVASTHNSLHNTAKSKVDVSKVARRDRESPFPMIGVDESLLVVRAIIAKLSIGSASPQKCIEEVPIQEAAGRVVARPVMAQCSVPPYRASVKDGYAAIASDKAGPRHVITAMLAGSQPLSGGVLGAGQCARVNTGAPVPPGADCVVQVEDTKVLQESEGGTEELQIEILTPPNVGQDIREVGSDVKQGETVLRVTQTPLTSSQVGLLASVGVFKVPCVRLPRVGVLSTGNELQLPGHSLTPGQIWDSNKVMLLTMFRQHGFPTVDLGIAKDEPDDTLAKLQEGIALSDVIVTTGSVSMGDRDLLKHVLKEDLGATIHFGRVNLKPGKPTTFATCAAPGGRTVVFFCLPGNPVSATVTSHLYVLPSLRHLAGRKQPDGQIVKAKIQSEVRLDSRVEFKRGVYRAGYSETPAQVEVLGGHMLSSNLLSVSTANCLVQLPGKTADKQIVERDSWVDVWLTGSKDKY
ncbi:gephyrin [Macrosteles quadrilineatus]|uniref:gephyrin n=1 Tax=Macrosteles quadrilineatus TaxID=74068 RepID=UPI0023E2A205|nr:gephyrin [Macrosteles quadrilineatus]